jgi:hypothetical protein
MSKNCFDCFVVFLCLRNLYSDSRQIIGSFERVISNSDSVQIFYGIHKLDTTLAFRQRFGWFLMRLEK